MPELDRLRRAYRSAGAAGEDHLSEEQWEALACDELDPDARRRALDHILSCPECSRVERALLALRREAHTFDPGAPAPVVSREEGSAARSRGWRGLLVGLAAAAAVVVAVLVARPGVRPGAGPSSGAPPAVLRSGGATAAPVPVAPVGTVRGTPGGFRWRAAEGARGYVVELLDADGESLWKSAELAETEAPWPSAVRTAPGRYYWRVLAIPGGGGEPVASDLVSFRVEVSASPR